MAAGHHQQQHGGEGDGGVVVDQPKRLATLTPVAETQKQELKTTKERPRSPSPALLALHQNVQNANQPKSAHHALASMSGGGMFRGFMGISSAMKKFRKSTASSIQTQEHVEVEHDDVMEEEPEESQHRHRHHHQHRRLSRSEPSISGLSSSDAAQSDSLTQSNTNLNALQSTYYVYKPPAPPPEPPEQMALLLAAKAGDWDTVESELKKCRKNDRRINMPDPETGKTALMFACQHSRFLLVGRLCEMGALLNVRSEDRRTALHYTAAEGHEEIVKALLRKSADPNLFGGKDSQLPLHIAAARANKALTAAQVLLRASLKNARLQKDGNGNLPITYAIEAGSLTLVKELLQTSAKEQVTWRQEQTGDYLVHIAAKKKSTEIMNALGLLGAANMNVQNNEGLTPLHIAARLGDDAMIRLLQPFKANPDVNDKKERTPLHVAAEHGHTQIVEILVERFKANVHMRTKDGSTLMHLAADKGYAETVLAFIKRGVPLHMPNKSGTSCLHVAAQNGHVAVVNTLIQKGSPVDGRTKDGYTALHLAVLNSKPDIIQVLLGFGAKVDLKGGQARETPLHIASKMPNGYFCAEMLLKSGALVNNATEESWETPLHITARYGYLELLKMLLEEGADPMRVNKYGESALHISIRHCHFEIAKALINFVNNLSAGREGTNLVNMANVEGETCFHLAAELGKSQTHNPFEDVDIIRLLLENGADPLAATKLTHETSLHYCARSGNPDIFQEICRHLGHSFQSACNRQDRMGWSALMTSCHEGHSSVAEILLTNSARADVFDEHGKAALHLAAENGHEACCEILLKHKAFVNAKSKLGITPLHFAAQNGFAELVKLLVEHYHASVNALSLDKKTPLHLAAENGRKEVCQNLLVLHADANAKDGLGQNPLHLAAENDHSDVVKLFMRFKPELVTTASKTGMTCAHIAANKGSVAVIKELMKFNRALITTAKNNINDSLPLHLAVSGGHKAVVRLLIDAGSSAIAENSEGMTAIHLAAKEGNIEVLQAIPRKISLRSLSQKNGLSPIHIAAFYGKAEIVRELQNRVDVNIKTIVPQLAASVSDHQLKTLITSDFGLTPLHLASAMGHESVVRLILNNSSVRTEEVTSLLSRVPLHYACQNGHLVVVSLLMSRSARHIRSKDKKGRVPLHLAAENGHVDMVSMLLGQGAEINATDQDGWTALHFATRNGNLKVVKLLIESGASPTIKTADGKVALVQSASGGHIDVLNYLLRRDHNSDELMEDNSFLLDLMLCAKTNGQQSIDEFVMHSEAPLYTSAKLAKLYRELANREKERAKDLNDAGRHCENMATELLGIAATLAPPSSILRATDSKGKQLLDMLLENNMKQVVEHAAVQRYLSDIWAGSLANWSTSRLFLLFVGFMFCPFLLMYYCLPFKHHSYHHIPVIKFLAMITSHLYLIFWFSLIAAIPVDPIVYRRDWTPFWYELVCLAWVSGMIVSELTSGGSSGLGLLRQVIILFSIVASLFQIAAIVIYPTPGANNRLQEAIDLMYLRNLMISIALFSSILLIIDFFLIHHLFGPFGIIIKSVLEDLMTFIVVLMLFLIAFTFLTCCLFSPLNSDSRFLSANQNRKNLTVTPAIPTNLTALNETSVDGSAKPDTVRKKRAADEPVAKCKPRHFDTKTQQAKKRKRRDAIEPDGYNNIGRMNAADQKGPLLSNIDYSSLVQLFELLYFTMFGMLDLRILPKVRNGPDWSSLMLTIYFGIWLIISTIVLIPLLIAMLTETYKRIHQRSDSEWKFGRAKLIRDMIKKPAAPPPLNLFVRAYLYLVSLRRHGWLMCTKYASYYAHEDEHEGADELLEMQDSQNVRSKSRKHSVAPGGKLKHSGLQRIQSVLDWSQVVKRHKSLHKGSIDEHAVDQGAEHVGGHDDGENVATGQHDDVANNATTMGDEGNNNNSAHV